MAHGHNRVHQVTTPVRLHTCSRTDSKHGETPLNSTPSMTGHPISTSRSRISPVRHRKRALLEELSAMRPVETGVVYSA